MFVSKDIEAKVMEAVTSATSSLSVVPSVSGSWQPASAGLVRWIDDGGEVATVNVAVGTAQCDTYTTPTVSFAVRATLFVRYDLDPEGTVLASIAEKLEGLFAGWQASTYQAAFTALDTTNFSVGNVSVQGGASPIVNRESGLVSVVWPLTLSGTYK